MASHGASMTHTGVRVRPRSDVAVKPTRCVRRAALSGRDSPAKCPPVTSTSTVHGAETPRRAVLTGLLALSLLPRPASAGELLSTRLEKKDFTKPVFNSRRPGAQEYPDWMEGTWSATAEFSGYAFPSKTMNPALLIKEPTIPGFQKLSLVYLPDVGSTQVSYEMRFARREPNGPVLEDRKFNLTSLVTAYLNQNAGPTMRKKVVEEVEYDNTKDANRTTVRLVQGVSVNAERIELFTNARESELREADGTFFCAESLRQVSLGYGREFGNARVVNTDYQHVWTFTPVYSDDEDDDDGETDKRNGSGKKQRKVNRVKVSLSTAGYAQPSDALRLSASPQTGGGAPIPQMGAAGISAFEPAVLYSHTIELVRN